MVVGLHRRIYTARFMIGWATFHLIDDLLSLVQYYVRTCYSEAASCFAIIPHFAIMP